MALAGHCSPEIRLPMVAMEQAKIDDLQETLQGLGLLAALGVVIVLVAMHFA